MRMHKSIYVLFKQDFRFFRQIGDQIGHFNDHCIKVKWLLPKFQLTHLEDFIDNLKQDSGCLPDLLPAFRLL